MPRTRHATRVRLPELFALCIGSSWAVIFQSLFFFGEFLRNCDLYDANIISVSSIIQLGSHPLRKVSKPIGAGILSVERGLEATSQ